MEGNLSLNVDNDSSGVSSPSTETLVNFPSNDALQHSKSSSTEINSSEISTTTHCINTTISKTKALIEAINAQNSVESKIGKQKSDGYNTSTTSPVNKPLQRLQSSSQKINYSRISANSTFSNTTSPVEDKNGEDNFEPNISDQKSETCNTSATPFVNFSPNKCLQGPQSSNEINDTEISMGTNHVVTTSSNTNALINGKKMPNNDAQMWKMMMNQLQEHVNDPQSSSNEVNHSESSARTYRVNTSSSNATVLIDENNVEIVEYESENIIASSPLTTPMVSATNQSSKSLSIFSSPSNTKNMNPKGSPLELYRSPNFCTEDSEDALQVHFQKNAQRAKYQKSRYLNAAQKPSLNVNSRQEILRKENMSKIENKKQVSSLSTRKNLKANTTQSNTIAEKTVTSSKKNTDSTFGMKTVSKTFTSSNKRNGTDTTNPKTSQKSPAFCNKSGGGDPSNPQTSLKSSALYRKNSGGDPSNPQTSLRSSALYRKNSGGDSSSLQTSQKSSTLSHKNNGDDPTSPQTCQKPFTLSQKKKIDDIAKIKQLQKSHGSFNRRSSGDATNSKTSSKQSSLVTSTKVDHQGSPTRNNTHNLDKNSVSQKQTSAETTAKTLSSDTSNFSSGSTCEENNSRDIQSKKHDETSKLSHTKKFTTPNQNEVVANPEVNGDETPTSTYSDEIGNVNGNHVKSHNQKFITYTQDMSPIINAENTPIETDSELSNDQSETSTTTMLHLSSQDESKEHTTSIEQPKLEKENLSISKKVAPEEKKPVPENDTKIEEETESTKETNENDDTSNSSDAKSPLITSLVTSIPSENSSLVSVTQSYLQEPNHLANRVNLHLTQETASSDDSNKHTLLKLVRVMEKPTKSQNDTNLMEKNGENNRVLVFARQSKSASDMERSSSTTQYSPREYVNVEAGPEKYPFVMGYRRKIQSNKNYIENNIEFTLTFRKKIDELYTDEVYMDEKESANDDSYIFTPRKSSSLVIERSPYDTNEFESSDNYMEYAQDDSCITTSRKCSLSEVFSGNSLNSRHFNLLECHLLKMKRLSQSYLRKDDSSDSRSLSSFSTSCPHITIKEIVSSGNLNYSHAMNIKKPAKQPSYCDNILRLEDLIDITTLKQSPKLIYADDDLREQTSTSTIFNSDEKYDVKDDEKEEKKQSELMYNLDNSTKVCPKKVIDLKTEENNTASGNIYVSPDQNSYYDNIIEVFTTVDETNDIQRKSSAGISSSTKLVKLTLIRDYSNDVENILTVSRYLAIEFLKETTCKQSDENEHASLDANTKNDDLFKANIRRILDFINRRRDAFIQNLEEKEKFDSMTKARYLKIIQILSQKIIEREERSNVENTGFTSIRTPSNEHLIILKHDRISSVETGPQVKLIKLKNLHPSHPFLSEPSNIKINIQNFFEQQNESSPFEESSELPQSSNSSNAANSKNDFNTCDVSEHRFLDYYDGPSTSKICKSYKQNQNDVHQHPFTSLKTSRCPQENATQTTVQSHYVNEHFKTLDVDEKNMKNSQPKEGPVLNNSSSEDKLNLTRQTPHNDLQNKIKPPKKVKPAKRMHGMPLKKVASEEDLAWKKPIDMKLKKIKQERENLLLIEKSKDIQESQIDNEYKKTIPPKNESVDITPSPLTFGKPKTEFVDGGLNISQHNGIPNSNDGGQVVLKSIATSTSLSYHLSESSDDKTVWPEDQLRNTNFGNRYNLSSSEDDDDSVEVIKVNNKILIKEWQQTIHSGLYHRIAGLNNTYYPPNDAKNWDFEELLVWKKKNPMKKVLTVSAKRRQAELTIYVGKNSVTCNKMPWVCFSKFFRDRYWHFEIHLPVDIVPFKSFRFIHKWILNRKCSVSRKEILQLYTAAKYLQIEDLVALIWDYIDSTKNFNEYTAYEMFLEARRVNMMNIARLMIPRMAKCFLTFVGTQEFLNMNLEDFMQLMESNNVGVNSELEIFMTIIRWVNHDWNNREKLLPSIIKAVRFGLIPPWILVLIQQKTPFTEFERVIRLPFIKKLIQDGLTMTTALSHTGADPAILLKHMDRYNFTIPKPRNWIFDPTCSYHHYIGCSKANNFSYGDFIQYIAQSLSEKDHWRKIHFANNIPASEIPICRDCVFYTFESEKVPDTICYPRMHVD